MPTAAKWSARFNALRRALAALPKYAHFRGGLCPGCAFQRNLTRTFGDAVPVAPVGPPGQYEAGEFLGAEPHTPLDVAVHTTLQGTGCIDNTEMSRITV